MSLPIWSFWTTMYEHEPRCTTQKLLSLVPLTPLTCHLNCPFCIPNPVFLFCILTFLLESSHHWWKFLPLIQEPLWAFPKHINLYPWHVESPLEPQHLYAVSFSCNSSRNPFQRKCDKSKIRAQVLLHLPKLSLFLILKWEKTCLVVLSLNSEIVFHTSKVINGS